MSSSCASYLRIPFIFVVLLVAAAPSVHAADASPVDSHVRTNERPLALLLQEAIAQSPFFRTMVDHLNESDVIVYLRNDRALPSNVDGRLALIGAAAGRRYVVVALAWGLPTLRAIATLGHELQHAIEVAERPDIVDQASLARAYAEIGFQGGMFRGGMSYDTVAALDAGDRVWAEVSRRAGTIAERATILETRP